MEESFQSIEEAMKHGFSSAEEMARDPDLHELQTQDPVRFGALLQRARSNAARRPARPSGRGEP